MFQPTHVLVSRAKKVPVQLVPAEKGLQLLTEPEWRQGKSPAFEFRPKLGFFCYGVQVVGYNLEPIAVTPASAESKVICGE